MAQFVNEEGYLTFPCDQYPFLFPVKGKPDQCTLYTPDFDAHFPHQNQTKHCWANYVEFHKCQILKGSDSPACRKFQRSYLSLCPNEWIEQWEEQRQSWKFPGQEIWVNAALQTDRVKELLKQYGANAKSNKDLTKLINENQELNEAIKDILANH